MGIHGYMGCGQGGYGGTGGGDYYEGILTIPRAPFYFTCFMGRWGVIPRRHGLSGVLCPGAVGRSAPVGGVDGAVV